MPGVGAATRWDDRPRGTNERFAGEPPCIAACATPSCDSSWGKFHVRKHPVSGALGRQHSPTTRGWHGSSGALRRLVLTVAALLAMVVGLGLPVVPAQAATANVTFSNGSTAPGGTGTVDGDGALNGVNQTDLTAWNPGTLTSGFGRFLLASFDVTIPAAAAPGDTFTVELPQYWQIRGVTGLVDLKDQAGETIATVKGSNTSAPKAITFTLTDYVATHQNVTGSYSFQAQEITDPNRPVGRLELPLTGNGSANVLTLKVNVPEPRWTAPFLTQAWRGPGDTPEGTIDARSMPSWDGSSDVRMSVYADNGYDIDCDALRNQDPSVEYGIGLAKIGSEINSAPTSERLLAPAQYTLECSRDHFTVTMSADQWRASAANGEVLRAVTKRIPNGETAWQGDEGVYAYLHLEQDGKTVERTSFNARPGSTATGNGEQVPPGSYVTRVFEDVNVNNVFDEGTDKPIAGVGVRLEGTTAAGAVAPMALTTDANGYVSASLRPGNYTTTVTRPAAMRPVTAKVGADAVDSDFPASGTLDFTIASRQAVRLDAGFAAQRPEVGIVKTVDGQDANTAPGARVTAGAQADFAYIVTNKGTTPLSEITVVDDRGVAVTFPAGFDGTLAPGASVTGNGKGVVPAGAYRNIGTVTAVPKNADGSAVLDDAGNPIATVTAADPAHAFGAAPGLTVLKEIQAEDGSWHTGADRPTLTIGKTVTWRITVNNTGNVDLTDVVVTDAAVPAGSKTIATLAAGANESWTFTSVVGDRPLTNAVTVNTTDPNCTTDCTPGSESGYEPEPEAVPALTVTKSSDLKSISRANEVITYSFLVKNTGNVTLTGVAVKDDAASFSGTGTLSAVTCPVTELAAGAETVCTTTYTVTQADIDSGHPLTNTATATGVPPAGGEVPSEPSENIVPNAAVGALEITKTSDVKTITAVGQKITYTFDVHNAGPVKVTDVKVLDDAAAFTGTGTLPAVTCPKTELAAGERMNCSTVYTVTLADLESAGLLNAATATGKDPQGEEVPSNPTDVTVPTVQAPALSVEKSSDLAKISAAGEKVTYSFLVKNAGNVTLKDVKVVDQADKFTGTGTLSPVTCPAAAASLAPGAEVTCTATYTVTQADIEAGTLINVAHATGVTPPGTEVPSPPTAVETPSDKAPALTVAKKADKTVLSVVGETVNYTFTVTNTGNVTLKDVAVRDDAATFTGTGTLSAVACPASVLAPKATMDCTASYVVTAGDLDSTALFNRATATGTDPDGGTVPSTPGDNTVPTEQNPALTLAKSSDRQSISAAGDVVNYAFLVTNTGNVTMRDITVLDGATGFTGSGTLSAVTCPTTVLAAGASTTCRASYTVTQADIDSAAPLKNVARVTGENPGGGTTPSEPSEEIVPNEAGSALNLVKTVDAKAITQAGQLLTYTFQVRNIGSTTVTDIAIVDDAEVFTGTGKLSPITCPTTTLAPAATVECKANYTVTQADVDSATGLFNLATVTGNGPDGETTPPTTGEVTTPPTQTPGLELKKTADVERIEKVGQKLSYTFVATNTGNVTLKDVSIVDDASRFTGTGKVSALDCPAEELASLAPGKSVTCTATYTVTQADLDSGQLRNVATATAVTPPGTEVEAPPTQVVTPTTEAPVLTLTKTADAQSIVREGQEVNYRFAITNTGNVKVTGLHVEERTFTGAGEKPTVTCPVTELEAGASTECTARYSTAIADLDTALLENVAVAHGTTAGGDSVDSNDSLAMVPTDATSGLELVKRSDAANITTAGQKVSYSFQVTNTGSSTVTGVRVQERDFNGSGRLSEPTCPKTTLTPGETITCVSVYTVAPADLELDALINSAVVTADGVDGPVTSEGSTAGVPNKDKPEAFEPVVEEDPQPSMPTPEAGPDAGSPLVNTGFSGGVLAAIAALLLVAGSILLAVRRRRA